MEQPNGRFQIVVSANIRKQQQQHRNKKEAGYRAGYRMPI
jgi:hypothetical protein